MKKDANKKILFLGITFFVLAAILLLSRLCVTEYGTGDISRAHLAWGSFADVAEDKSCAVINDSNETIYYVDYDTQEVRFLLNAADLPVENASVSYVCLDSENNLYITVVEKDENGRGNLSERILSYDSNGEFLEEYMISDEKIRRG